MVQKESTFIRENDENVIVNDRYLEQEEPDDPVPTCIDEILNVNEPIDFEIFEQPRFPIALWNVCYRVESELPRTNNSMEAFHGAFKVKF